MANDYGQRAVDAMNAGRQEVANTLDSAADRFEEKTSTSADKVKSAAQYLREHDVKDMAGDMTSFVKAHPIPAILGAVVVGFLAGRAARHG